LFSLQPEFFSVNDAKLVLLIVDDSALIIEKMISLLQDLENIRIIFQASNYAEAVGIIEEMEPDIVLADIFLRDKIGLDLIKFIREKHPAVEIGILTNHSGKHYRNVCKNLGVHHFFDKTMDFELVLKMIGAKTKAN
jgi:DNA-binding NarL/FixJ family response regulator